MERITRSAIAQGLDKTRYKKTAIAKLGKSLRTPRYRIKKLGIAWRHLGVRDFLPSYSSSFMSVFLKIRTKNTRPFCYLRLHDCRLWPDLRGFRAADPRVHKGHHTSL